LKQDFINYVKNEFSFSDKEIKDFENSLKKPLKKSLRVNTNKISIDNFKKLAIKNNWQLSETPL
jgi:16S rRNA (cytosine1407-C5)-methyltransferase